MRVKTISIVIRNSSPSLQLIAIAFITAFLFLSCAKRPVSDVAYSSFNRIPVGPGPEDMVLDTFSSDPRLLVSCTERRLKNVPFGEIYAVNLATDSSRILPRINNPGDLVFQPHGIDLVKNQYGEVLLYCISHNEEKKEHSIVIYKVFDDRLEFMRKIDHPLLVSPNDLAASASDEIYVTNDAGKRGSFIEALFKLKRGTVVMYNPSDSSWKIVAQKLLYANGVSIAKDHRVIVSTVRQNALYSFPESGGGDKKIIARLFGLDNISWVNENEILVTAHPDLYKFLKHYKNRKKKSPSVVYRVNVSTGAVKTIFSDDGSQISASSTAIWYEGRLFISQVFEPYLLELQ